MEVLRFRGASFHKMCLLCGERNAPPAPTEREIHSKFGSFSNDLVQCESTSKFELPTPSLAAWKQASAWQVVKRMVSRTAEAFYLAPGFYPGLPGFGGVRTLKEGADLSGLPRILVARGGVVD